jgi:hypothetical protein
VVPRAIWWEFVRKPWEETFGEPLLEKLQEVFFLQVWLALHEFLNVGFGVVTVRDIRLHCPELFPLLTSGRDLGQRVTRFPAC